MNVTHDPQQQRFTIRIGHYEAALMYARDGDHIDLYHIYVPDPYRAKGHAVALLKAAFDYARDQGLVVTPSCPFIAEQFLPRFPQYHGLVRPGEFPFA